MIQIIPAILATTEEKYSQTLKKIEESGFFEEGWVQIDLMDGQFVERKSVEVDVIAKNPTNLRLEAHLMVEQPDSWISQLIHTPVKRIIFPVEDGEIEKRIKDIKGREIEVGLALNPETPIEKVEPFLGQIDCVLIMSVHPGRQGQKFLEEALEKIRELNSLRQHFGYGFAIGVDGGVSFENAKLVVDAGANYLVVGSHLIEGNIDENLEAFWEALQ